LPLSPIFSLPPPASSHIDTLSLHDALPISDPGGGRRRQFVQPVLRSKDKGVVTTIGEHTGDERGHGEVPDPDGSRPRAGRVGDRDRKSTRLNSSHVSISYAVFCLKKKIYII